MKITTLFRQILIAVLLGTLTLATLNVTALNGEKRHVSIKIDKTDAKDALVDVNIDGNTEVFNLPELAVGESKTIATRSGKTITASRNERGMSIELDGQTIDLPVINGNLSAQMQNNLPLHEVMQDMINISGVELDENQKQIILDAFVTAGINKKINFSNHDFKFITIDSNENHFFSKDGGSAEIEIQLDSDEDVQFISKDGKDMIIKKVILIDQKTD